MHCRQISLGVHTILPKHAAAGSVKRLSHKLYFAALAGDEDVGDWLGRRPWIRQFNIDYFLDEVMDDDHIDDIFEYFKEAETDDLSEAISELGTDYSEEEIRLVRIKFLSEMGN